MTIGKAATPESDDCNHEHKKEDAFALADHDVNNSKDLEGTINSIMETHRFGINIDGFSRSGSKWCEKSVMNIVVE